MKTSKEIINAIQKRIKEDRGYVDFASLNSVIENVLGANYYGKGYNEGSHTPEYNTLNLCVQLGLMRKVWDKRFKSEKLGYWVDEPYREGLKYPYV
jgi:hypothetical protein